MLLIYKVIVHLESFKSFCDLIIILKFIKTTSKENTILRCRTHSRINSKILNLKIDLSLLYLRP